MSTDTVPQTPPDSKPQFTLSKDGKDILTGDSFDCVRYIHNHHGYSLDWAMRFEGYKLTPATGDTA